MNHLGDERRKWHLAKEIPVTLLVMVAIQTGGFIWWLASLSAKVEEGIKTTARLEARVEGIASSSPQQLLNTAKIAGLEIDLERLRVRLDSIQLEQQRRAPFIPHKTE